MLPFQHANICGSNSCSGNSGIFHLVDRNNASSELVSRKDSIQMDERRELSLHPAHSRAGRHISRKSIRLLNLSNSQSIFFPIAQQRPFPPCGAGFCRGLLLRPGVQLAVASGSNPISNSDIVGWKECSQSAAACACDVAIKDCL